MPAICPVNDNPILVSHVIDLSLAMAYQVQKRLLTPNTPMVSAGAPSGGDGVRALRNSVRSTLELEIMLRYLG